MKEDLSPELNKAASALERLPALNPPEGLTGRVMERLPRDRALGDRLACALRSAAGRGGLFLPSNPFELGLSFFGAGIFFFVVGLIVTFRLAVAGPAAEMAGQVLLVSLLPSLAASLILLRAGWGQLFRRGGAKGTLPVAIVAGVLFFLTSISGAPLKAPQEMWILAAWYGLSGLIAVSGLALAAAFTAGETGVAYDEVPI